MAADSSRSRTVADDSRPVRAGAETVLTIRRAGLADVDRIAPLFDAYRVFYGQPSDEITAAAFLRARIERNQSVIFVAEQSISSATSSGVTPTSSRTSATEAAHVSTRSEPARSSAIALGFTQLYPSFSSVSVAPIVILNDLFVSPAGRCRGVARALLRRAEEHAHETGAVRLALTTARDNVRAQRVYEANGWERDEVFFAYNRKVE